MLELKDLENKSLYIIREAYAEFEKPAVLWRAWVRIALLYSALPKGFLRQDSLLGDSYRHRIQV